MDNSQRFKLHAEANFEGVAISKDGKFLDANKQLADMLGCELDELIGTNVLNFVAKKDKEMVKGYQEEKYEKPYEHMAVKKDGTLFPVEIHGRTLPDGLRLTAVRNMTRYYEVDKLRKAIWDMMNFANMFVLVLDDKMNIKFSNYSLYQALGFKTHDEILGKCWLDFIKKEDNRSITAIHHSISTNAEDSEQFKEYRNNIIGINGEEFSVKWFNAHINSDFNWSFSIGLRGEIPVMITEDSVRSYYNEVISNDRTMILSLRNSILGKVPDIDGECEIKE